MGDFHMVGVAVNERGRWPAGSVDPAEAPSVLERAERTLRALRDPRGRPVLAEVHRAADVYRGPFAARFPDLVVELDPAFMAGGGPDEPLFAPHRDPGTDWGSHRQEGVLVLSGPGVRPAALQATPRVEDVAPTLMRLQGLAFAHEVDGRVLGEVLDPVPVLPAPAVPQTRPQAGAPPIEAEEEAQIEGMLRGLGYIE
jgi:predicted AlkP superfamily phosphohydrolase/phosphomutase